MLLAALALATAVPAQAASLVAASPGEPHWLNDDPCPQDSICMRYPALVAFDRSKTLSGPRVSRRFSARVYLHTRFGKRARIAMVVIPVGAAYRATAWSYVTQDGYACFTKSSLNKIKLDGRATKPGDNTDICVRID